MTAICAGTPQLISCCRTDKASRRRFFYRSSEPNMSILKLNKKNPVPIDAVHINHLSVSFIATTRHQRGSDARLRAPRTAQSHSRIGLDPLSRRCTKAGSALRLRRLSALSERFRARADHYCAAWDAPKTAGIKAATPRFLDIDLSFATSSPSKVYASVLDPSCIKSRSN